MIPPPSVSAKWGIVTQKKSFTRQSPPLELLTSSKMPQLLRSVIVNSEKKKTFSSSQRLLHSALICLLWEKHKQQQIEGRQRLCMLTREEGTELRTGQSWGRDRAEDRMARRLALLLLWPTLFFTTVTSQHDNGICIYQTFTLGRLTCMCTLV